MLLEIEKIYKYYGDIKANNGITFAIEPGTVHGILGENGAGKSTLMKILSGYIRKSKGSILINSKPVNFSTPAQASLCGIGMLYQDPMDFDTLTVLDDFILGHGGPYTWHRNNLRKKLLQIATELNFSFRPDDRVCDLSLGKRQQLELLRLLSVGGELLILDEPTTGISSLQKEILFSALKKLAREGKTIIVVSHKLEEVMMLCDKVTVLRKGKVSGESAKPFKRSALLSMMFDMPPVSPKLSTRNFGKDLLVMNRISAFEGRAGLLDLNICIRKNEVVGLAGLEGSGQELFLRIAAGLTAPAKGKVFLDNRDMNGKDYHAFKQNGVAFLPGQRLKEGLITGLTVAQHFSLKRYHEKLFPVKHASWNDAKKNIDAFQIKGTPGSVVQTLSGGNQQRLLFSLLPEAPCLLLLETPTRGLDVESVHFVWQQIHNLRDKGTAVVFSSQDFDEIFAVADRVIVFFNGCVTKDLRMEKTNTQEISSAIAGIPHATTH